MRLDRVQKHLCLKGLQQPGYYKSRDSWIKTASPGEPAKAAAALEKGLQALR